MILFERHRVIVIMITDLVFRYSEFFKNNEILKFNHHEKNRAFDMILYLHREINCLRHLITQLIVASRSWQEALLRRLLSMILITKSNFE